MGLPITADECLAVVRDALAAQTLHGCRAGMSSDEVIALLGAPVARSRSRKRRMTLGYEGGLLIYFSEDMLVSIHHDLPQRVPVERVEPLVTTLGHRRRELEPNCIALDVGCIQLEIIGSTVFAVHLTTEHS